MPDRQEHITEQLQDLLKQISISLSFVLSKVLEDSSLTFHQVYILKVISKKPSINLTALCKELKLSKGAMSLTINKLVEAGLVQRFENPADRRNRYIALTEKGEKVLKKTLEKSREVFNRLTYNLTTEELEEIIGSLSKLNASISSAIQQDRTFNKQ